MRTEIITDQPDLLIRRMILEPGEATPWHVDKCRRFTVVVRGERLRIELEASDTVHDVPVRSGLAEWDEPTDDVHRAVTAGSSTFEEVVMFFRTVPHEDPQPPS